jgi:hypothetical protein
MMSLLTILGGLLALYALTFPYNLARNYITARKTGLPIIVVPIDQGHPLWMVTCVPLRLTFKVSDDLKPAPALDDSLPKLILPTRNTSQHGSTNVSTSASTAGSSATESGPSNNSASLGTTRPSSL